MDMPKTLTVSDAEAALASFEAGPPATVRVPTRGKHLQAGGEAAMVQAYITWARDRERTKLKTWIVDEADADGQIHSLSRQFFGISAILLSDEISDRSGRDITQPVREAGLERLAVLQSERAREASRGPQYEIICADHLNLSAPRLLYAHDIQGRTKLKGVASFEKLAQEIVTAIVPANLSVGLDEGFAPAMGAALYELIRNTDEHAQQDDQRRRLKRSLRCVQARLHSVTPAALTDIVAGSPPLADYVGRLRPAHARAAQIQMMELSVIDSGPGLAPAFTGKRSSELSAVEEGDAVRECFSKHATRKDSENAGLGLPNVIDTLRERGGFLRVRTGRQALYSDLSLEAGRAYEELPDLKPWFTDRTPAYACGTLMTFLVPLTRGE